MEVRLETGRTHQVRVHLKHIGHTLVGDVDYGARLPPKALRKDTRLRSLAKMLEAVPGQLLHATVLGFASISADGVFDDDSEPRSFSYDLPTVFVEIVDFLRDNCDASD